MKRNVILFDDDHWSDLLPLTYMRPMARLRCGMLTIVEKWQHYLDAQVSYMTQPHLAEVYGTDLTEDNIVIAGNVLPNPLIARLILDLEPNEAIMHGEDLIATRLDRQQFDRLMNEEEADELVGYHIEDEAPVQVLKNLWDILKYHEDQMHQDYRLLTKGRTSGDLPAHVHFIGDRKDLFIEEGVTIEHAYIDTTSGPVYLAKDSKILMGAMIKGPFSAGEASLVKMGAKIYGPVALGPYCKVAGELKNVSMIGYTNKAHDGFLGDSVIAPWCNFGADTNTSNLKNDYGQVAIHSIARGELEKTDQQFVGLFMGDHSKCGINTMFNTGTVIGVSCNLFGGGFMPKYVPSFSWGGADGLQPYRFDKAVEVAERVVARRGKVLSESMIKLFKEVHDMKPHAS